MTGSISEWTLRVLEAFIIFFIGMAIGRFSGNFTQQFLEVAGLDELFEHLRIEIVPSRILGNIVLYGIYGGAVFFALARLKMAVIATVAAGIIIIAFSIAGALLGIKDSIANFFAGMKIRKQIGSKRSIKVFEKKWLIRKVLRTKIIAVRDGDTLAIPYTFFRKSD